MSTTTEAPRRSPGTVTVVVVLMWISVAVLLLFGLLLLVGAAGITAGATQAEIEKALADAGFPTSWAPAVGPVMFSLAAAMFIFAVIQALFAVFLSKGSNVARILITILLAIRLAASLVSMFTVPAFIAQAIIDVIINIVILALLWNARANEFFTDRVRVARWRPGVTLESAFVPGLLVVLLIILSFASPVFFSSRNLGQILVQASTLGIVAVGATYVIIAGDLDLSIGANVALSGVMTAIAMAQWNLPWIAGVGVGIGCGLLIGLANGLLSAYLKVAAFIATLGTGVVATGIAVYLTKGLTIAGLPDIFGDLAKARILGLQALVWWMLATFVIGGIVLHFTNYGIRVFAVGGNRDAAYLAGIAVSRTRLLAFVIAGFTGGLAGMLLTARVQAGQPGISQTLTLYATAAVILGGTSILGGQGSLLRTFFGILLIAVVQNGLDILGVDFALQQVAVGTVFILAACSEALRRRR